MNSKIIDGITNIDGELIEKYWIYKHKYREKRKRNLKWLVSAVAACLILSISIPTAIIYTPVEYDLNYKREDDYFANAWKTINTWIYYPENTNLKRERVRLPGNAYSIFVAWKHINNIGDDVIWLDYEYKSTETVSNLDLQREYAFHFQNDKTAKKKYVLWITISRDIEAYFEKSDGYTLMLSLVRTLTEPDKIVYSDIYVIFE